MIGSLISCKCVYEFIAFWFSHLVSVWRDDTWQLSKAFSWLDSHTEDGFGDRASPREKSKPHGPISGGRVGSAKGANGRDCET